MGMQAQEVKIEKQFVESREQFERIVSGLITEDSLKMRHNEIEEMLRVDGMKLLRQLMADHFELRHIKEQKPLSIKGIDGIERKEIKKSKRGLMTIFGPVQVPRLAYGAKGRESLHPMDRELNLPQEKQSFGLRQRVAIEVTKASFDEAVTAIKQTTGASIGKRQTEALALKAAIDFELFYQQREQASQPSSEILVISTDGKGIVVRKEDLRSQTRKSADKQTHKMAKRLSKGEKLNRKRMAQVATVYTIAPFMRTASDIVKELAPVKEINYQRPKPEHKRVWASIENAASSVIAQAFDEALRRDPNQEKRWAILIDGNPIQLDIINKQIEHLKIKPIIILDIIHVLEYLWSAAFAFYGQASPLAQDWVSERLLRILQGKSQGVAAGMRRSATLLALCKQARLPIDKCADYLLKYQVYLRYHLYLAQGLPIATGVIEGACRHLIQDRMDITGARWSLKGAEAVLRLRSLRASQDFDLYWQFHLNQEFIRNHSLYFYENF